MFKFLHAADLHLDSPLRGLDRYEGAPVDAIRQATRKAVQNLVELAIREQVAFVLIAGDIYDGDWRDYNTGLFFVGQMTRLKDAGITVYFIRGNHDAESVISKELRLPPNVHSFPTDAPKTLYHADTNTAIHGQGFAKRAITADLSQSYPARDSACFNIGLLHTSAGGHAEHETYAPCTVEGLLARDYAYWALGHVHERKTLHNDGSIIAFSGNCQGRHIRETGPKGCDLVTVNGDDVSVEFCELDVFRWSRLNVDASECAVDDDLLAEVAEQIGCARQSADGRTTAVRIEITGTYRCHDDLVGDAERWEHEIRSVAIQEAGEAVWVEKIRFQTTPATVIDDRLAEGPLVELRRLIADVQQDESLVADLGSELADLQKKLPPEVKEFLMRDRQGASNLNGPEWLRPLIGDAGRMLLARLTD